MAKLNGTLYCVYSATDKLLHNDSCSLTLDMDMPVTSNKEDAGWATHLDGGGERSWVIDISGLYDEEGVGITPDEILAAIIARSADTAIHFKATSGETKGWYGNGTYKNVKLTADKEQAVKFTCQIVGNGALTTE